MFSVSFYPDELQRELLIADLWERGTEGIQETSIMIRAFFADRAQAEDAAVAHQQFDPQVQQEEERDYVSEFLQQWPSLTVGEKFFVVPDWRESDPAPDNRIKIVLTPGQAFGTGRHQSTQLCLMALEKIPIAGRDVIDIGTGTGVLAFAAKMLGAQTVLGTDNDPDAIAAAIENVARQDAKDQPTWTVGSLEFEVGTMDQLGEFDVVLANIVADTHLQLHADYWRILRSGGHLVISGFEDHEVASMVKTLGQTPVHDLQQDTWHALVFQKT
jgi:ribosomal protein L11 methyltransferase